MVVQIKTWVRRQKMIKRLLLLLLVAFVATIIDWLVIHNNWQFPGYHVLGWFVVWGLCFWILRDIILSLASVVIISVIEDFLYLYYGALIGERQFYPIYCHAWIPEAFGEWATFLSLNWLGMPSCYFVLLGLGIVLILIRRRPLRVKVNVMKLRNVRSGGLWKLGKRRALSPP